MLESDFPAIYRSADKRSKSARRTFFIVLALQLFLLALTTFFSVLDKPSQLLVAAQCFSLLMSLLFLLYITICDPQKLWYNERSIAESIKTAAWCYMMGSAPYNADDDRAKELFLKRISQFIKASPGVPPRERDKRTALQVTITMD